jgi:hypothetical protein
VKAPEGPDRLHQSVVCDQFPWNQILMPGSPLFEDLLDLADRPFLRRGNHANPSVVSPRDKRMRADLLPAETGVSVRPPMQGDIKVAGKDLPLRTIVQLNQVTF